MIIKSNEFGSVVTFPAIPICSQDEVVLLTQFGEICVFWNKLYWKWHRESNY